MLVNVFMDRLLYPGMDTLQSKLCAIGCILKSIQIQIYT